MISFHNLTPYCDPLVAFGEKLATSRVTNRVALVFLILTGCSDNSGGNHDLGATTDAAVGSEVTESGGGNPWATQDGANVDDVQSDGLAPRSPDSTGDSVLPDLTDPVDDPDLGAPQDLFNGGPDISEPLTDTDNDGIMDPYDNCPDIPNPGQQNMDFDAFGDLCDDDLDGDSVPNEFDPFPAQPLMPGSALKNTVYGHSSSHLYLLDAKIYKVVAVGPFLWPTSFPNEEMTDIAIDSYGVLYGVSYDHLWVCHPQTAACSHMGQLPTSFNGLAVLPAGTYDEEADVLVGVTIEGDWFQLEPKQGKVAATLIGSYGAGYTSAGDAFSLIGVGTYAAVETANSFQSVLAAIDPLTGSVTKEIGKIGNYSAIYGLAGWTSKVFAFDESGAVIVLDVTTGAVLTTLLDTNVSWWGAAGRVNPAEP